MTPKAYNQNQVCHVTLSVHLLYTEMLMYVSKHDTVSNQMQNKLQYADNKVVSMFQIASAICTHPYHCFSASFVAGDLQHKTLTSFETSLHVSWNWSYHFIDDSWDKIIVMFLGYMCGYILYLRLWPVCDEILITITPIKQECEGLWLKCWYSVLLQM